MPDRPDARPAIEVFRHHGAYYARFSDPRVLEAFEQDIIPTAFTHDADPLGVLRHTARDNPEADVILVAASAATEPHPVDTTRFRNKQTRS